MSRIIQQCHICFHPVDILTGIQYAEPEAKLLYAVICENPEHGRIRTHFLNTKEEAIKAWDEKRVIEEDKP